MNLANKLTIFRILLIPVFIVLMTFESIPHWASLATLVFIVASITDQLDGYIARSRNMVTNFGIFLDPFADKLLVTAAIIILVSKMLIPAWVAIVIVAREFAVSGLRTIAANGGHVIPASIWGKLKTVTQMIAIILFMVQMALNSEFGKSSFLSYDKTLGKLPLILIYIATILTLFSGVDYFLKSWKSIDPNN